METILMPTDFSAASRNAVDYAAEVAALTNSTLILFHAYHVPMVHSEVPMQIPTLSEIENDAMEEMKKMGRHLHVKFPNLVIKYKNVCGFAVEEIEQYASSVKADLVVMGMKGAGLLTQKLIGSITTSLIQRAKFPVLAIDESVRFKAPKKIVLASDYSEIKNREIFGPLKELAQLFSSHIYVLNVVPQLEAVPAVDKAIAGVNLEHNLEGMDHSFHFSENEKVMDGINQFIKTKNMDMLVMIPRKHFFLKELFTEGNTKRMAFNSNVPLLALHE